MLNRPQRVGRLARRFVRLVNRPIVARRRRHTEELLTELSPAGPPLAQKVLIDAAFDNPNYWFRLAIMRAALGLHDAEEIGLLGVFRAQAARETLNRLGVRETRALTLVKPNRNHRAIIERLLAKTRTAEEVLSWSLPLGLPASDMYDGLLKHQRRASLDITDPQLVARGAELLAMQEAAERVFDDERPDLLLISHVASARTSYGPIVWAATRRNIPVAVPWGLMGTLRLYRLSRWDEVYRWPGVPNAADLLGLAAQARQRLAETGRRYLELRLQGRTGESSGIDAYGTPATRIDRQRLAASFGSAVERPKVAIYASVWFDNPHVYGMTAFRDFEDWINVTYEVAARAPHIDWLFKPHPAEAFYGGLGLKDMLPSTLPANVKLCPSDWNGRAVIDAVDGIVTLNGTVGIEGAFLGKPVLCADRGWYDDAGLALLAEGREDYVSLLGQRWWERSIRTEERRCNAELFAGWYFGCAASDKLLAYGEDLLQDRLYRMNADMLREHAPAVRREIEQVRAWWLSDEHDYHSYKMRRAMDFALPAIVS